jgi:predicted amidohydrolase
MNKTIRFGGAQIPVTPSITKNLTTIKTAIDWASENKVDYLVTPEASLSGYSVEFDKDLDLLSTSLTTIENYAKEKNVGLCLGTLWIEKYSNKPVGVKRNQIRFYSKEGKLIGITDKHVLTPFDLKIGIESGTPHLIAIPIDNGILPVAGLVCADLYGHISNQGGLPQKYYENGIKLYIHSTNAERGLDPNPIRDEIEELWLEANIRRVSGYMVPMVVVDNCYKMDGTEYHGRTMTQSGVCFFGEWVTTVPRTGTQYFYHDFSIDDLLNC